MVEETVVPGNTHRQYGNECYDCRRGNEKATEQMMVPQQAIRFKTLKNYMHLLEQLPSKEPHS